MFKNIAEEYDMEFPPYSEYEKVYKQFVEKIKSEGPEKKRNMPLPTWADEGL